MIHIYPLRGTNKHKDKIRSIFKLHLSPTGDEQTLPSSFANLSKLFIPYGGRTNEYLYRSSCRHQIYPLRGTNKLPVRGLVLLHFIYPLRGTNKLPVRGLVLLHFIYPLRGTNKQILLYRIVLPLHLSPAGDEQTKFFP